MARPRKPESEKLGPTIAWRVKASVKEDFQRQYAESGLTQSEFMRELLERRKATIVARPKSSLDKKRMLFLFNKSSNNINQLAYRANADHLEGILSEATYSRILAALEQIAEHMKAVVDHAD